MEKHILNYKIIVEKERHKGKIVYVASCPALGLFDWGKTIDQSMGRITKLIKFHLESLEDAGQPIPIEKESTTIMTSIEIPIRPNVKFSYV